MIVFQIGGLSQHELREHVRRIVIQINEVKDDSLSIQEVERLVSGMVEQRLNEEKLANQNQWLEEQEAARLKAEEVSHLGLTYCPSLSSYLGLLSVLT